MDNIIKNYEEPLLKPANTRQYISYLRHKLKVNRENKKIQKLNNKNNSQHDHSHDHNHSNDNIAPEGINILSFAIVIDDVVVDIMNAQEGFANILQQNPKFILLKENDHRPHQGWIYKDGEFVDLGQIINEVRPTTRG